MTLQEQARQSGLVLLNEAAEWDKNDWPPLVGRWRDEHASVVLDHHLGTDKNSQEHTVVVLGGYQTGQGFVNSVLLLNLANTTDKQWREGPPMNKTRFGHAAVVCNGGIYVMGGNNGPNLDCIERIDANDLLQASSTSTSSQQKIHWVTLNCRLSTGRNSCRAVAVHNRFLVAMGGYHDRFLSSVDIIDTSRNQHTVTAGPSMNVPRRLCGCAVIGHRIFVVGGYNEGGELNSVEYVDFTTMPCDNQESKEQTVGMVISFSSSWTTHSELVLSSGRSPCAVGALGSCLVVAGGWGSTVEALDTHRNRVWNLPLLENDRHSCSLVTVANQIAVIGAFRNASCATLPLLDKNTWCFRKLCEQPRNDWYQQFREGMGIQYYVNRTSCTTSTFNRKRMRAKTCHGGGGNEKDCT